MADKRLLQGQGLTYDTDRTLYIDIGGQTYAIAAGAIVMVGDALADGTNPVPVVLVNPADGSPATDGITDALVVIDTLHHEVHKGELYSVFYLTPHASPLADDATIVLALRSATMYLHFQAFGAAGGDAEIEFYVGSTIAADGTLMVPNNHNGEKGNNSDAIVRRDPTVVAAGNWCDGFLIPGGTGGNAVGGASGQRHEWVIPPATWAFARLTNRAGNAQPGCLKCVWYEEESNG